MAVSELTDTATTKKEWRYRIRYEERKRWAISQEVMSFLVISMSSRSSGVQTNVPMTGCKIIFLIISVNILFCSRDTHLQTSPRTENPDTDTPLTYSFQLIHIQSCCLCCLLCKDNVYSYAILSSVLFTLQRRCLFINKTICVPLVL